MPATRQYKKRIAEKRCYDCGLQLTYVGRCERCKQLKRDRYAINKAAGTCPNDGKPSAIKPGSFCEACLTQGRVKDKRKRQKLRDEVFQAYGGYKCSCPGCDVT